MAEPQPAAVQDGMDPEGPPPPADAEGRKAAAAMSSLETWGKEDDGESKPNKQIDQEALGKAISRLELADMAGKIAAGDKGDKLAREKEEKEKRSKVKVDQADVKLLVEELDLTKVKATELLKAHEGDAVRVMRAFVRAIA
jgi:NACalpha-BTF3-like transcription factor